MIVGLFDKPSANENSVIDVLVFIHITQHIIYHHDVNCTMYIEPYNSFTNTHPIIKQFDDSRHLLNAKCEMKNNNTSEPRIHQHLFIGHWCAHLHTPHAMQNNNNNNEILYCVFWSCSSSIPFFTNSFKISCALLCFDCLLVVVLVLVLVLSLDLNECGAKSTEICANNQNRANSRIYMPIYRCIFCSHAHFLPVASIHRTDSQNNFHMCTDKHLHRQYEYTFMHVYNTHTHTILQTLFVCSLANLSVLDECARVFVCVCDDYGNFVRDICTTYYTILYYTLLHGEYMLVYINTDLKCGAAVCIFFCLFFL